VNRTINMVRRPTTGATVLRATICWGKRIGIAHAEVGRTDAAATRAKVLAWTQHQQIAAQAGDLVGHHARRAIAERDHGNDCCHTDDDTQHREK
jgi:hypothetical protein